MQQQYGNIQERIDILNNGAMEKSVLDSIDRPVHIVKLVEALKKFPSFSEKFVITDGNNRRRSVYGNEWMIAPKKEVLLEVGRLYTAREECEIREL